VNKICILAVTCAVVIASAFLPTHSNAAEFKIVADADATIANSNPDQTVGYHLRADGSGGANKIYLRFFVGWTAGQKILSAKLTMGTRDWQHDPDKSFDVYQLNDASPDDSRLGWDENTLTANNAPANDKNGNGFDSQLAQKLGVMPGGDVPDNSNPDQKPRGTCAFDSPALADAISNDTNGYLTLMITETAGAGNSCFASRYDQINYQPLLDITTDGPGGVDMTQPTFVVTSGARQTISGYGCGSGGDHGIKIPGSYADQNGQNLGDFSDQPERMQKYFDMLFKDTGANSIRLWMGDMDLKSWDKGYYRTGEFKAAQRAGVTRFFMCANPPDTMYAPAPTPDSYGIQPLSDAGVKDYPERLAEFASRVKKKYGIELYMITIANEELRITIKQWPLVVKNLRAALDARGLNKVKIGAVDWPSADNYLWDRYKSIQDDPEAWKDLDVLTFHSYGISMTERYYGQFLQGQPGKEMWETESNSGGPTASSPAKDIAGHMMNDINHGA